MADNQPAEGIATYLMGKAEGLETAAKTYLADHPELQEQLGGLGTKEDLLAMVMIGLVLSFIILLAALMRFRPSRREIEMQAAANDKLLFPKYNYTQVNHRDDINDRRTAY